MTEPKIRFRTDDGSSFPEWEEKTLSAIFTERTETSVISDDAPLLSFTIEQGVINPEDKKSNKRDFLMKDKDNKKFSVTELDDIIYNPANLKFGAIHRNKLGRGVVSPIYAIFYTEQNPAFMECVVRNSAFIKKSLTFLEGTVEKLKTLKPRDFLRMKVFIPSLSEQQKIADFLSNVDEVIVASEEEVANLEQQKKAVMQKIFSQEVRFKKEDGSDFPDWDSVPFGDVIEQYSQRTKEENEDVLLSCAIEGVYLNSELFGHQRGSSTIGYKKIEKGTLILSAQNLHLGNANVNRRFEHGIISPAYNTYRITGCNVDFMAHWIKRDATKRFFFDATTTGASECRRNVVWDELYKQTMDIPSIPEQQLIANFLDSYDEAITAAKQELAKWKELKKGLLQQMFV